MRITFTVPGKPRGKGRPRFSRGRAYTPEKTREYEELIRRCYLLHGGVKLEGAVTLSILAIYPIPKKTKAADRQRMVQGYELPLKKPDGDNIEKAVADALNGVAYDDDSQIVSARWEKRFGADDEHVGLVVTVSDGEDTQ